MIEPMPRRDFLWRSGGGLGGIALAALLGRDGLLAATGPGGDVARRGPTSTGGCITAPRCAG